MKRSEFVKILAIVSEEELNAYNGQTEFSDFSRNAWYATYVQWTNEKGIVNGTSTTTFSSNAAITPQEMAVMIKRYADYKEITLPQTVEKQTFVDDDDIATWAKALLPPCSKPASSTAKAAMFSILWATPPEGKPPK